jgi:hypothetical protein
LGRLGGDESDAEIVQGATKLCGLPFAGELLLERPAVIVADEDAAVIAVEGGGHAEAAQQQLQQAEIAFRGFREEELRGDNFAAGIVLHAQSGEARATSFEPVVWATVELHEFAFAGDAQSALTMHGGAVACVESRGLAYAANGAEFRG